MAATADNEVTAVSDLANQTRFRILMANFATTIVSVAVLTSLAPFFADIRMADLVTFAPFLLAVTAIAGTAQVFLNERDLKRIVYFSHPDDPSARRLEPVYWLIVKIVMGLSIISVVFVPLILWAYDVTILDLYRMGITGILNFLLADFVAVIVMGVGLFFHAKLDRETAETAARARTHVNPASVQHLADNFALRAAIVSMGLWGFGAMSSAIITLKVLKWGNFFALFIMSVTIGIGVIVFPFQYFVFRRLFRPLKKRVLQSLSQSFAVASLSEASSVLKNEDMEKGRILFHFRLVGGVFTATIFYIFGDQVPAYMFWTGMTYTCVTLLCLGLTYMGDRIAAYSEYLRIMSDGVALILLIQFAGSMTTPGPGIFFVMIMAICLQKDFETAMVSTVFFSALYGGVLLLEFYGYLPYAPYIPNNLLLETVLKNGLWASYPPAALFALNFALVSGGMLLGALLGRHFRRRYDLDRNEQDDILDGLK